MPDDDPAATSERLRAAREQAQALHDRLAGLAKEIAETERQAAGIYEELARTRPDERAGHLSQHAQHARDFAVHEEQYAEEHPPQPDAPDPA